MSDWIGLIFFVLLIVGLRSGRLVEATTFSLLVGLTWTACFAVAAVGELNLISVAFAVLFIWNRLVASRMIGDSSAGTPL